MSLALHKTNLWTRRDHWSRHLHQVETESELETQNWCRVRGSWALIRSLLRLQQCRMSHVARSLDNCRGQPVAGSEGYNSIADPNAAWPPPQCNCSQVTHCFPYLLRLPAPPPLHPIPAHGVARTRTRTRTDVDACSCAWHHCRSWQRVSLGECQSECHCEYSLWTVGNTLRVGLRLQLRLRLRLGPG